MRGGWQSFHRLKKVHQNMKSYSCRKLTPKGPVWVAYHPGSHGCGTHSTAGSRDVLSPWSVGSGEHHNIEGCVEASHSAQDSPPQWRILVWRLETPQLRLPKQVPGYRVSARGGLARETCEFHLHVTARKTEAWSGDDPSLSQGQAVRWVSLSSLCCYKSTLRG